VYCIRILSNKLDLTKIVLLVVLPPISQPDTQHNYTQHKDIQHNDTQKTVKICGWFCIGFISSFVDCFIVSLAGGVNDSLADR
jgi:hypothetical protein